MSSALVLGGAGTFGRLVARELVLRGAAVTIAGRNLDRARTVAGALVPPQRALAVDITRPETYREPFAAHAVVIHCAGPFHGQDSSLLEVCLEAGCHYVDIAEDRAYASLVRSHDRAFRERGLWAVTGCSSLPGISCALALRARESLGTTPVRARVTLFIGNANPKGRAAVRTLVAGLGRPIAAPQGELHGFRDPERVELPEPFGSRIVYSFESPEYDLLPDRIGVGSVSVKVGFELRLATLGLAALAAVPIRYGAAWADALQFLSRLFKALGHSGGAVMTELFAGDGSMRRAAVSGADDGQRMAALPCALVAVGLYQGPRPGGGAATAHDYLGATELLSQLQAAGFQLTLD